ncbi:MAG: alanine racemase [Chloroflexi bacterium]|nr:alanine racemase [Chloroflexota bacterium]
MLSIKFSKFHYKRTFKIHFGDYVPALPFVLPPPILARMTSQHANSTWLEIDQGAITNNLLKFQEFTSTAVMAVVKANGYGHGMIQVAKAAESVGARYCGVARVEEALELRKKGLAIPVLVLGYTPDERFQEAIMEDISLTVFQPEQIETLAMAFDKTHRQSTVHVKVDSGMSRLGATPTEAYTLVQELSKMESVFLEGIFTHYACADDPSLPATDKQEKEFFELLSELDASASKPPIIHAANSAAALTRPSSYLDMVRIGIALYGMAPSKWVPLPDGIRPSLEWKAQLTAVYSLPPGRGISYGHEYVTTRNERIGVIPVGYGDGYRRISGNEVLLHGRRAALVGRVCMDQVIVQLDEFPEAQVGDEVVLLGRQGSEQILADQLADTWGTINYEVTCGVSARVPRFYHGEA